MDSEDSHGASSDNESLRKTSPASSRSRASNTRSPLSSSGSRSPQSGPESPKSPQSRSSSRSRSGASSRSSHSPGNPPRSPDGEGPRSPSPANSSRSNSPIEEPKSPIQVNNATTRSPISSRSSKSKSVSPDRLSNASVSSKGSRRGKRGNEDDGNTSDSSAVSVDSCSRKNKNISKSADTQPEEISDGDIESDHEKDVEPVEKPKTPTKAEISIAHEDLSDVSDLDESIGGHSDEQDMEEPIKPIDDKEEADIKHQEKPENHEEGEEQLDFEAEDGECDLDESKKEKEDKDGSLIEEGEAVDSKDKEKEKTKEELEEGEVSDEDDVRPEETEPRPVCRFFSRGQCTWGASCRFLHPGVTDKGNYTMFELIRPVVPGEYGREERPYPNRAEPAPIESAWERGLRTAKEMLRKSIKRKEQDIDFEEKKMNLSLAQEELDKENGYYGRVASPEPRYVRHMPVDYPPVVRPPPPPPHDEYYGRRQVIYEPEYAPPPPRERVRTYRELPSHRMPDYYNSKYEEEMVPSTAKPPPRKPKREVIVQRVEERPVRGDEWSDPWMRSKSPVGRKSGSGGGGGGGGGGTGGGGGARRRSYSSGSSYSSSSSSSRSSDSSRSSRSRSRSRHKRMARTHKSRQVSPSVIVSERKAANERAALMNPPAPRKRASSPSMMRVSAANPPAPLKEDQFGRTRSKLAAALARVKGHRRSSKSSSESSGSSSSDSDSSASSSSSSRDGSSPRRASAVDNITIAKAMDALKGGSSEKRQIKLTLKNPASARKQEISDIARKAEALQGKKRPASSPPPTDPKSKKVTSRREELLKQLKAVEDAIAKKRSKVN